MQDAHCVGTALVHLAPVDKQGRAGVRVPAADASFYGHTLTAEFADLDYLGVEPTEMAFE